MARSFRTINVSFSTTFIGPKRTFSIAPSRIVTKSAQFESLVDSCPNVLIDARQPIMRGTDTRGAPVVLAGLEVG